MSNVWLKNDYDTALNSVLGNAIGIELTRHEAERAYYPFYYDNKPIDGTLAYCLKADDEFVSYMYLDKSEDDSFLEYQTLSFEKAVPLGYIGELTELGVVLLEGSDVNVDWRAENDTLQGSIFIPNGCILSASTASPRASIRSVELFGTHIGFYLTTNDSECRVVVYAKYKLHTGVIDRHISGFTSGGYITPHVNSGLLLQKCILMPMSGSYETSVFIKKKIHNDSGNDRNVAYYSAPDNTKYLNSGKQYELTPTANKNAKYGDMYWAAFNNARDYRLRFIFGIA